MTNKKLISRIISAALSLLLAFTIIFTSYGSIFGEVEAYGSTYVSDIQVFSAGTLDNAIKKCENAGYTPVKKNINRSSSGDVADNGIYIVGYKTTNDSKEAVTDISLLQMNAGYQNYTYADIAERAIEKLGNIPLELENSVKEFKENYDKKSPAALVAVEVLNCYCIDELDGIKLGDYLVSGNCSIDFIKKIFARSSSSVVSTFCNALVGGVADFGEDNWAKRIQESTELQKELEDDANYKRLDNTYKVYATELTDSLQAFATGYHDAYNRYEKNNKKIEEVVVDEKDVTEIPDETVDAMTNGDEIEKENGDAFYLYAYSLLNQYNYDADTKLGDYIVSLGDLSYDESKNLRKIYPLVDSITNGQIATMRLCGIACSAIYLINDSGISEVAKEQIDEIKKEIKSEIKSDSMSIWIGTDQTIYEQKVAVTTNAFRANSAGQMYNTLTSPDEVDEFIESAMSKLEIAMSVIGIGYGITFISTSLIGMFSTTIITSLGASASVWAICCAGIGAGVFSSILGVLGCAFVILNYIALVVMLIVLLAMLIKYLWDLFSDDDAEDFTEIPSVMFDVVDNRYVKYDVIREDGKPSNINGDNARRWNALYYTKSTYAGDPICSSQMDDLITIQYDDSKTPQGYKAVKNFGEVYNANLNANSKSDSCSIYMFYKTTTNEINEGTQQGKELYLSKIALSVESSETAAKAGLTRNGYKVLDKNLTPVCASIKKYTYLGFCTTTNPNDAITDIRISAQNSSSAFMYGNASYACCGTLPTGHSLYYTSYKSAGSPILADITVKNSLKDVPKGYEPINLFCGGNAFNCNVGADLDNTLKRTTTAQEYSHWNDEGIYLYFRPSVAYTEGEEYISGIILVQGHNQKHIGNTADDYINALGLKKLNGNLTYASKIQLPTEAHGFVSEEQYEDNIDTYIAYSTTHNPYRAIYGIRSYAAAPGNYTVPAFLGNMTSGSYAVSEVFYELPYTPVAYSSEYYNRGIYPSHSYTCCSKGGDKTGIAQQTPTSEFSPEDYEKVSWNSCTVRGKGLYVLGPVEGGTPLTIKDINITSSATTPTGFTSVQDFKTPNRTEPHNLGFKSTNSNYITKGKECTPVYIYLRQEAPVEKKYISSISVSTYSLDSATGGAKDLPKETKEIVNKTCNDYCIQNLLSSCTDEIVQANIAIDYESSIYSNPKSTNYTASYIGVTRTNSESKAITGIIRYITDQKDVANIITVGGVNYTKAGDMVKDPKGSYYLYYTTSSGANPGSPITSISANSEVFDSDCATAMSTKSLDVSEIKTGNEITREGVKATLFGDDNSSSFIHMNYLDTATMMGAIYIGHGKTKKEAQCNLLSLGCNMCINMDVNKNAGGEYVYIGYTKYTLLASEIKKGVAKYAVRDIVLTVGQPHQESLTLNGVKYKSAVDEFTSSKNSDPTEAVSLNRGNGGKQIYLYYTTTKTDETAYPIARLGIACKDYAMLNSESSKWEHILDINNNRINVNEYALGTQDDGKYIVDNRIYLYASRVDNAVKEDAAVDMNSINKEFVSYEVSMKGA